MKANFKLQASACLLAFMLFSSEAAQGAAFNEKGLNMATACVLNKNYKGAHEQFESMANHGCKYSQCALGIMSQKGLGTPQNFQQAIYWFEKSASQGFADAEHRLGKLYLGGNGVPRNTDLAIHYLKKAAAHGVVEAQEELGKLGVQDYADTQRARISQAAKDGLNKAEQVAASIPAIPGGNAQPNNDFARGVSNIQESWTGYASVAKSLDGALANN